MSGFTFKQQVNVSLRERVTNDLRDAILNGNLEPGQRIKETEIAEQMGVSRGPVREAIRQLEREGILISQPYKETVVADLKAEEVKDVLIPVRYHLEMFVIKKYIEEMNEEFFAGLQEIVDEMDRLSDGDNKLRLVELDIFFHQAILELAEERTVFLTWNSILNQIRMHFSKNIQYFHTENLAPDHQALLDCLKSKDISKIQKEMATHLKGNTAILFSISDEEGE